MSSVTVHTIQVHSITPQTTLVPRSSCHRSRTRESTGEDRRTGTRRSIGSRRLADGDERRKLVTTVREKSRTPFSRYQTIIGGKLRSRDPAAQKKRNNARLQHPQSDVLKSAGLSQSKSRSETSSWSYCLCFRFLCATAPCVERCIEDGMLESYADTAGRLGDHQGEDDAGD